MSPSMWSSPSVAPCHVQHRKCAYQFRLTLDTDLGINRANLGANRIDTHAEQIAAFLWRQTLAPNADTNPHFGQRQGK